VFEEVLDLFAGEGSAVVALEDQRRPVLEEVGLEGGGRGK